MKKVLLTLVAVLMAVPAFAAEIYNSNEGENTVDLYGTIRGFLGYGHGAGDFKGDSNDLLYGLQGNSRLGVRVKLGNFTGNVEIGANEATLTGNAANNIGLRQAWGAYSFGRAGQILVGKTDTPTTMGGFSSDILDTDGGLNGFGGNSTSNRRFQMQYNVVGVSIAIIEPDAILYGNTAGLGYTAMNVRLYDDGRVSTSLDKKSGAISIIPRLAISYTYKNPSLLAKVGITYTAINGYKSSIVNAYNGDAEDPTNSLVVDNDWRTVHAFGIVAGVRPTFNNGKIWLSVQARYGMNEDLYGEAKTAIPTLNHAGGFAYAAQSLGDRLEFDGGGNIDISRFNVGLEVGGNFNNLVALLGGVGYQGTFSSEDGFDTINSLGVYVQLPLTISKNFALIPQVSYLNTSIDGDAQDAIVLMMQARVTF